MEPEVQKPSIFLASELHLAADGKPRDAVSPRAIRPDDGLLAAGLGAVEILTRDELQGPSSGDCEIVTCRMPDASPRRLFCKYGPAVEAGQPRQRFGVAYEAQVYDQLLPAWQDEVLALHGALLDETTQTVGLALAYAEGAAPLHLVPEPNAGLGAAARWIARFHRWGETSAVPPFLHRYDTEFYRVWSQRAGRFTGRLHERFPWLPEFCERCQRRLPALLPPATIIHGEYQADNILMHHGRYVPVDWQSAALADGEIDLASLTWGWDDDLVAFCEQQYCLARWPDGAPDDFALRLTAARVFLRLRWLGGSHAEDQLEKMVFDLQELLPLAEKLRALDT